MAAMKGDGDGAVLEQFVEADQLPVLVGQDERRHLLARLRGVFADVVLLEPRHQLVDRVLEIWPEPSHRVGEGLEPFGERGVHVAALDEGFFQQH